MHEQKKSGISISTQAAVAMMLVLFVHYVARALPGALGYGGPAGIVIPVLMGLLILGIVLVFWERTA